MGWKLDLIPLLTQRPQDLSGGQKQRVSLAGVLIDESPILLFDEPLANLDPKSGQDIIELIDQIHKEEGTTTLIIEHRLEDVLHRPVDRIVLIMMVASSLMGALTSYWRLICWLKMEFENPFI